MKREEGGGERMWIDGETGVREGRKEGGRWRRDMAG